jgi:EmrB/QacA subfamily drug resistance transporter
VTATASNPVDAGAAPPGLTHRRILIIYGALMVGTLLAALDQTIIATALPTIVGDLGGLNHLSWVVTAYLLTSTCSTPVWGKLGDLHGRKRMFQASIVIFVIGSILSGFTESMMQLILFRGVQGLGAGGLMSLPMAITGDILSPRQRGRYQGYMVGVFALSSIAGPAIGGFFTQNLSWRWCFYINIPIGIVALVVTSSVLNLPFQKVQRRIDYLGAALLMLSVAGLLLVTVWGGTTYAWNSMQIMVLLVGSILLLIWFVWHERRAEEPVLPLRLFRNPVIRVTNVISFLSGMAMFGATVYMPLFLQLVAGVSPILSGFLMFPMMAGVTVSSIITGRLISRTGRYKRYPILGAVLMPLGMFLLSTMNEHTPVWKAGLYMFPLGAGVGLIMPVLMVALQNAAEQKDLGAATSSNVFFRSMGSSFGVAIFGAIMTAQLAYWIPKLVPKTALHISGTSVAFSPAAVHHLPGPVQTGIIQAFAHSLHAVFLWATPIALLTLPFVLILKELPLRDHAFIQSATVNAVGGESAGEPVEPVQSLTPEPG